MEHLWVAIATIRQNCAMFHACMPAIKVVNKGMTKAEYIGAIGERPRMFGAFGRGLRKAWSAAMSAQIVAMMQFDKFGRVKP